MSRVLVLLVLGVIGLGLMLTVAEMPLFGRTDGPAWQGSAAHYMENAKEETKALNIISAILVDYRAYDTLIETTVLFTGTTAMLALIYQHKKGKEK